MSYRKRLEQLEWLDMSPPPFTPSEYRICLQQLGRIGRLTGGDKATLRAFSRLGAAPKTILDVGCGGGDFAMVLGRHYPHAEVHGIDLSQAAIDYAREHSSSVPNVIFQCVKEKELHYPPKAFDVVTCTLVCHHMSDSELIDFLKRARRVASKAVIINDLHRTPVASLVFAVMAPLLFPSRLIRHDGLVSIRRAFTRKDWERYLQAAEVPESAFEIHWSLGFRWIVTVKAESTS